jgi:hypothetical protein
MRHYDSDSAPPRDNSQSVTATGRSFLPPYRTDYGNIYSGKLTAGRMVYAVWSCSTVDPMPSLVDEALKHIG